MSPKEEGEEDAEVPLPAREPTTRKLANTVLRKHGVIINHELVGFAAQAIEIIANNHECSLEDAADALAHSIKTYQGTSLNSGKPVNRFWFEDSSWKFFLPRAA
jgi:hypothetical protein